MWPAMYQVVNTVLCVLSKTSMPKFSRNIIRSACRPYRTKSYASLLSLSNFRLFSRSAAMLEESSINIYFVLSDGSRLPAKGKVGESLYDVKVNNNLDLEGYGACEGNLSCSTCHLILKQEDYDRIGNPDHDEEDVLDTAIGVTKTSRLGCQVFLKKEMDGIEVHVPLERHDRRGD